MSDAKKVTLTIPQLIAACCALVGAFSVMFHLGKTIGESQWAVREKEMLTRYERQTIAMEETHKGVVDDLKRELEKVKADCAGVSGASADVFVSGNFAKGLSVGLNTSGGATGWATRLNDCIRLDYPGGHTWGTWFITAGQATKEGGKRRFLDFSQYRTLSLELKGEKGTSVVIALKDVYDDHSGAESRHSIQLRGDDWETYDIDLKQFRSTDLARLYVIMSFVFDAAPQTVFVRAIQFR